MFTAFHLDLSLAISLTSGGWRFMQVSPQLTRAMPLTAPQMCCLPFPGLGCVLTRQRSVFTVPWVQSKPSVMAAATILPEVQTQPYLCWITSPGAFCFWNVLFSAVLPAFIELQVRTRHTPLFSCCRSYSVELGASQLGLGMGPHAWGWADILEEDVCGFPVLECASR